MARLGSRTPDLAQVMPFVLRAWMYLSGVMYSLAGKARHQPEAIQILMPLNRPGPHHLRKPDRPRLTPDEQRGGSGPNAGPDPPPIAFEIRCW